MTVETIGPRGVVLDALGDPRVWSRDHGGRELGIQRTDECGCADCASRAPEQLVFPQAVGGMVDNRAW